MNKINMFLDRYSRYSQLVLRVGLGAVFVWFGWSSFSNPDMWVRLVPAWTEAIGSPVTLVKIHGAVELVFGLLLVLGIKKRFAATILFISLLNTLTLVSGPTLVRDIGLAFALFSLILKPKNQA